MVLILQNTLNKIKTIVGETPKRNLYFKSFTTSTIKYSSPQNYIGEIFKSDLTTPNGELLSYLNDFSKLLVSINTLVDPKQIHTVRIKFYKFFTAIEYGKDHVSYLKTRISS